MSLVWESSVYIWNFRFVFHRVLKFLQTLRVVQNNEPIRDKLKQYREAYNYGTETGLGTVDDENLVNSVCSEVRYPCRSTQKSLQRSTRALVDFAGFWSPIDRVHLLYITIFIIFYHAQPWYTRRKTVHRNNFYLIRVEKKKRIETCDLAGRLSHHYLYVRTKLCNLFFLFFFFLIYYTSIKIKIK